jgi:hypothetical protein
MNVIVPESCVGGADARVAPRLTPKVKPCVNTFRARFFCHAIAVCSARRRADCASCPLDPFTQCFFNVFLSGKKPVNALAAAVSLLFGFRQIENTVLEFRKHFDLIWTTFQVGGHD